MKMRPSVCGAAAEGAHIVLLDARGKGMTSEDFAEMLGSLRDVGTKDLAFDDRRPDGLAALPGKKQAVAWPLVPRPGRICWPARCGRAGFIALHILAGHPYHRA